mmetsp:Transcript_4606/g.6548  ORF Transcript_4606/g.6548 Transcript_4606/m.6548 type:complete len:513 (-) Transcript_4606:232-1770(-)
MASTSTDLYNPQAHQNMNHSGTTAGIASFAAQPGQSSMTSFTGAMNAPGVNPNGTLGTAGAPGSVSALTAAAVAANQTGAVSGFTAAQQAQAAQQQAANAAAATNASSFLDDQQRFMLLDQSNRNQMILQRQTEYTNQLAAAAAGSRNAAFINPNLLLTGTPQANTAASRLGLGMDPSLLGNTAAGLSVATAGAPTQAGTMAGATTTGAGATGMNPSDHLALFSAQAAAANAANAQAAAQAAQQAVNVRAAARGAASTTQGSQAAALSGMLPTSAASAALSATHPAMFAAAAQQFNTHPAMRGLNAAQISGLDAAAAASTAAGLDPTLTANLNFLNAQVGDAATAGGFESVLKQDHDMNHHQHRPNSNNNNNKGGNGHPNNREMPVRPLSAYNFFFRDERERILNEDKPDSEKTNITQPDPEQEDAEALEKKKKRLLDQHLLKDRSKRRPHRKTHGKIGFTSLSKLIGKRWRELSDEKKQYYRDVAAMDMDRYQRDVAEYNKGRLFQKPATK